MEKFTLPIWVGIKHVDLTKMIDQTVAIMTEALIMTVGGGTSQVV